MSEAPTSDAARRAAARKAKILARGNTGLQKLAQTARGEEADELYGDSASSTPRSPPSPGPGLGPQSSSSASARGPTWAPPGPTTTSSTPAGASSDELRAAQEEFLSASSGGDGDAGGRDPFGGDPFGGDPFGGLGGGAGDMPDMAQLLAQMLGMPPPGSGPNLLGDLDDPAGLGGSGGGGGPPFPFPGMGGMPANFPNFPGMSGMPGAPGMGGQGPQGKRKSAVQRYWPLVHSAAVLALVAFAVVWWEPALHAANKGGLSILPIGGSWVHRWARLQGKTGVWAKVPEFAAGHLAPMPLFWAFTTIQLILQTTRFFVLRSPPPPHSLIQNFMPLLPPALARPLITGSRYLTMLSQFWKDGCLLVFALGMVVVGSGLWADTSGSASGSPLWS